MEVNLELEEDTDLSKFVYTPRQDGNDNGHIKQYRVEVSMDGDEYEEVSTGTLEADADVKTIDLQNTTAKYVKFVVEDGEHDFASASQFSLHKVLDSESNMPVEDTSDLKELVKQFEDADDISSDETVNALKLHLKALAQFEKKEDNEKVVKHLHGFKDLLDYHQGEMTDEAYETLINGSDTLIDELG